MAQQSGDSNPTSQEMGTADEQKLKHMEFVQVAFLHALICISKLYNVAKEKSGPLKPSVQTVEGTIKTIVGPVYKKFHDVPAKVIKYIDGKVDESITSVNCHVPPAVKQMTSAASAVATEVKKAGVVDTASGLAKSAYTKYEPVAKELYSKYEPVAEQYAVSAWRRLNQLPVFPKVAQAVLPTAVCCTEKYNQTVQVAADKGYKVLSYLPLIPTERIAKIFNPESPPAPGH